MNVTDGLICLRLHLGGQQLDNLREVNECVLVVIADGNTRGKDRVVGVKSTETRRELCRELVKFARLYTVDDLRKHLLSESIGIYL